MELDQLLRKVTAAWAPNPGPQTLAYYSKADILFYGGAAGGGKTDLLLGVALLYRRSLILRRVFPSLRAIVDRSRMLYNREGSNPQRDSYNESLHRWKLQDKRGWQQVRFGSCQHEKNVLEWQGQPHDFYGFDEVPEFTQYMMRYITTWNRSLDITNRTRKERIILTGNPPTTPEGMWILEFFAPWLDEQHPNPARIGELRWYSTLEGKDAETGPEPFMHKGELIVPKSRTFIPALLEDNPILAATGYRAQLQSLPEPLRSKMLYGSFTAGIEDHPMQLIPTDWVKLAQKRWRDNREPDSPVDACGIDVARGGRDRTVFSPKKGRRLLEQTEYEGKFTKDGDKVATLALKLTTEETVCKVDVIGVGSSAYDAIKKVRKTVAMNASEGTEEQDRTRLLWFKNRRSLWYWRFMEWLDPQKGLDLELPPGNELLADLCAPRFKVSGGIIVVEPKEDIIERLQRSPDKGDSCIYAFADAPVMAGQGVFDLYAATFKDWKTEQEKQERDMERFHQHTRSK